MNICIFSKFLEGVHKQAGGMERHVSLAVESFIKKSCKVVIITSRHPKGIKKEIRKNLVIHYTHSTITRNPLTRVRFFKESAEIYKNIKEEYKIDAIFSQHEMGWGFFKHHNDKPSVTVLHGITKNEFKASIKFKPWLLPLWAIIYPYYSHLEKDCIKKSSKVICVSKDLEKELLKTYKVQENKLLVVENGVDINKFKPMNNKDIQKLRKNYATPDEKIILYAGSLIMTKGVQVTINILPQLLKNNKIKFLIIGSGNYEEELKSLVKKHKLDSNVIFLGRIDNKDLPKYYNLADVFSMSTLRIEGFPYVLIESLACGTPTVASKSGGNSSLIKDGETGLFVKRGDENDLYEKLNNLLNDKDLSKKLKINSRKEALDRFDSEKNMGKIVEIFSKITND